MPSAGSRIRTRKTRKRSARSSGRWSWMSGVARTAILPVWNNKKRESRVARAGRRGGCESRDVYFVFPFFFFFYCLVLLAAGMEGGKEGERRSVTVTVFCLIDYWCCCAAGPLSLPWWDLVGVWPTWWLCEEGMTSCRNVGSWRGVSFARRLINCSVPSVITFISILYYIILFHHHGLG